MAAEVRVRHNTTGVERTIPYKTYSLIPKTYTALAFYDKDGNEVENPLAKPAPKIAVKKKPVEVAGDEFGLPEKRSPGRPKMTEAEKEAKRQEMERINNAAIEKAKNKTA